MKPQLDPIYLEKLQDYYAEHKVIPSYSVLATLWGISAKSWVSECVKRYEEVGILGWTPDKQLKPGARFFERRLTDQPVQAGLPNPAISDGYDLITLDDYLVRLPSKTSLVRVKGESMIDAGIHDGDLIIVEQQPNANIGEIVVAIVDNEFTVKYLDREKNGQFVLKPANKAFPVIRPRGGLEIFGVMAGLARRTR
ncbi:LexA family protein [Usitatibacter palustris]|uniref:LexA repressor n=1 Tax=Usitatibacter palustris TaxID=2732487 RepID=A0A6M4H6H9_9PROT|nr:S24 family peptidase [Usitatibacter palustris]QJR14548.1 LexA repressor [Usitatibacter palustris]